MVVGEIEVGTDVLVIGSGPAGYTAAMRCGRMGLDTTLAGTLLGGVCLNLGCIPYKSLLYSLGLLLEARESGSSGAKERAMIDLKRAQERKDQVIHRLRDGIAGELKRCSVQVMEGFCSFESSSTAIVRGSHGSQHIEFKRAVIATGSRFQLPEGIRIEGTRMITPYGLAAIDKIPDHAAVLGGGFSGMTSTSLLSRMGAEVTFAYKGKSPVSSIDGDILRPALQWMEKNKVRLLPEASWQVSSDGRAVKIISRGKEEDITPDLIVFATPQVPNTDRLNIGRTKVKLDRKGFVIVDGDYRTADPAIYAIGDVLGGVRNASTAYREGISVANVLTGKPGLPGYQAMPFTMYTEPPIATAGLTETQARAKGMDVVVGKAPYSIVGAATLSDKTAGLAKVVADKASHRILGVQVIGADSGNIIAEGILAIEMGARLEDVALTMHPHPELCEVFYEACARAARLCP